MVLAFGKTEAMTPGPSDTQPSDAKLIRLTALGNSHAFASLYDRYSPQLFGLLLRILHSHAEAEDGVLTTFARKTPLSRKHFPISSLGQRK